MKNAIQLAINNLRKSVTCSICLGYFNLPVTLACSHSYCADCIEPVIRSKRPCPICSSAIKSRNVTSEAGMSDIVDSVSAFMDSMEEFCSPITHIPVPETRFRNAATASAQHVSSTVSANTTPTMVAMVEACTGEVSSSSGAVAGPPQVVSTFNVGDLVEVAARTSAGMNKLGGIAKVTAVLPFAVNDGATTHRYSVKYVLDGLVESDLHASYVMEYRDVDRSARRHRIVDPAVPAMSSGDHKRKLLGGDEASAHTGSSGTKLTRSETAGNEAAITSGTKETSPGVANPHGRTIVLLSTALDPYLQSKLTLLAERCDGVSVTNSFSDAVTHVVADADKSRTLKNRTMKYMQALITGRWIVSVQWVADCLKRQTLIAEEAYEVASNAKASIPGAPRRARHALSLASAGLFSGHRVLLFGQFPQPGPAKSDIRFLLERGAAVLCGGAPDMLLCLPEQSSAPKQNIVVVTGKEYAEQFWREAKALRGEEGGAEAKLSARITVTSFTWVLDCVVNFSVMPFVVVP